MLEVHTVLCRAGKMDNYSYLLRDSKSNAVIVIDPSESAPIEAKLAELNWRPNYIFNTHHHFDHTDGNLPLKQKFDAKVVGNINDSERLPAFDIGLKPDETYTLPDIAPATAQNQAATTFTALDVSAHTQGHLAYYFPSAKALFTGDTLFNLCIGGLFEGTPEQMFAALQKIRTLPDDTKFYPGHEYTAGGAAEAWAYFGGNRDIAAYLEQAKQKLGQGLPAGPITLGQEKKCNPYLAAATLHEFKSLF